MYLSHGTWHGISTAGVPDQLVTITGTSLHDLWASAEDASGNAIDTVYHHVHSWSSVVLGDNDVNGVSSRSPGDAWFGGAGPDTNAQVDVDKNGRVKPASEAFTDNAAFAGIDAHDPSRVLAVGYEIQSKHFDLDIQQATC
jgi:hypothetical protein